MAAPIWISHRGLSQQHDENSLPAFTAACKAGFPWLETDLHTTQDKHIVLSHDFTLDQLTSCSGNIADMTRAELENIRHRKGGAYLFLDEFLLRFAEQHWVFDIKPATATRTIRILSELLTLKKSLLSNITFLFWNKELEENFVTDFPGAICFSREPQCYRAGIAAVCGLPALGDIQKNKIYAIIPKVSLFPLLSKRVVLAFHRRGAQVIGYLPATAAEVQICLDAGVDYILSNDPPPASIH